MSRLSTTQLETSIEKLSEQLSAVDLEMAAPESWSDQKKSKRLQKQRKKLQDELEPLEFEWSRRAEAE